MILTARKQEVRDIVVTTKWQVQYFNYFTKTWVPLSGFMTDFAKAYKRLLWYDSQGDKVRLKKVEGTT